MSDVFISYAHENKSIASELARHLESLGHSVWWDAALLASDDFNDVIASALTRARAVIVIWTPASVRSNFVRDEARFALQRGKLVSVKMPEMTYDQLPFGFQGQHTDDIGSWERIVMAVQRLGATPSGAAAAVDAGKGAADDEHVAWAKARGAGDIDTLTAFMSTYPRSQYRGQAIERLRTMLRTNPDEAAAAVRSNSSSLSALLKGLTFRVPDFISSSAAKWNVVGLLIVYAVAILSIFYIVVTITGPTEQKWQHVIQSISGILALASMFHFFKFVNQRLLVASIILGLLASLMIFVVNMYLVFHLVENKLFIDHQQLSAFAVLVPPIVWLAIAIWRVRRAR